MTTKNNRKRTEELRNQAKIGNKLPGRNISEQSEIEQARVENRREADLDDKTPTGDAGVEDNNEPSRLDNDEPIY